MPVFFSSGNVETRGQVQLLVLPGAAPLDIVTVPRWGGFNGFKSILTGISMSEATNQQFLHTLGNDIFVYVFGEQIGQFGLSGISFYGNCNEGGGGRIGIAHVRDYYRQMRITNNPRPLLVTIQPRTVLRCFLTGFRAEVMDPALRMFQFHLSMALVPE